MGDQGEGRRNVISDLHALSWSKNLAWTGEFKTYRNRTCPLILGYRPVGNLSENPQFLFHWQRFIVLDVIAVASHGHRPANSDSKISGLDEAHHDRQSFFGPFSVA